MRLRLRADATFETLRLRSYRAGIDSLKLHYGTAAPLPPLRNQIVEARLGSEQPFLQAGPGSLLQPLPFFDRHHDGSLNSTAGHNLRALLDGRIQELAETRFCVLHLPGSQISPLDTPTQYTD